jgi:hypothetical protein
VQQLFLDQRQHHFAASKLRGNSVEGLRILPEKQGQNLAVTVLCVPFSLGSSLCLSS